MARFSSFKDFWPFYLAQHRIPLNRGLHYLGVVGSLVFLASVVAGRIGWVWLPLTPVIGYAPAWVGHFWIEKNRPATLSYPRYSLIGDFKMFGLAVTGKLGAELERAASDASSI